MELCPLLEDLLKSIGMNMLQNSSKKRDIYTVLWPKLLLCNS
jgi:hypothetical protein